MENALFGGNRHFDQSLIPWATFTEPEVAHTGLYERDFARRGLECETYKADLAHVDRAILEGAAPGFVKVGALTGITHAYCSMGPCMLSRDNLW